ncbi:hypothetical protein MYAM1_000465 [Malassezia yamatoensis]|uniref:Tetratricopeptide SHNi-TPR domain-containing protein n=1 Tax=Malassezia yamatoensis TaxID=253288 RepID=A0AAJ5YS19_9BASI|nr:hypothetical protein MYAM1_000465 [Malassezia yamatoensis]
MSSKSSAISIADNVKQQLDEAARSFALKKYEQTADLLASALEELREQYGEDAPELAPILHQYGRALLEHVIEAGGALGNGGTVDTQHSAEKAVDLSFNEIASGKEAEQAAEESKSSGKRKALDVSETNEEGQEEEEDDDDDLAVAFAVLDLARVILERILDTSASQPATSQDTSHRTNQKAELKTLTGEIFDEKALIAELGEVYNDLGDVGLESENFEQASEDYASSLRLLSPLLKPYSRRLSDAHLRLGLALEFHPDTSRREAAVAQVEQASNVLRRRLVQLGEPKNLPSDEYMFSEKDNIGAFDADQLQREIRDVKDVLKDVEAKLDEMRNSPETLKADGTLANTELEATIREAFLNAAKSATEENTSFHTTDKNVDQPVNNLNTRVKKKQKSQP